MTKLTFNGKTIGLEDLQKNTKALPRVEIPRAELAIEKLPFAERSDNKEEPSEQVCVYKHEGRWAILSGHSKVRDFLASTGAVIKACLVSKQMFKHLQVVAVPAQVQNRQAADDERQMRDAEMADSDQTQPAPYRRYDNRPQGNNDRFGRDRQNTGFNGGYRRA